MSKILIINGSHREKNTYNLLKKIERQLNEHTIEFINVSNYNVHPCMGCEKCLRKGLCHIQDEANTILEKIIESDGVIIGTPIYLRQIPGSLKNIFDRGCEWYHRSPVVGKPMFFVTTTQVTGTKIAINYLRDLTVQWGIIYTGRISRTVFNLDKPIDVRKLNKFKHYLNKKNLKNHKPSTKNLFEFYTQRVLAEEILPIDQEYWEEKGYLNRPYFFECKINIFKRLIGFLYYKFLKNIISKNKKE